LIGGENIIEQEEIQNKAKKGVGSIIVIGIIVLIALGILGFSLINNNRGESLATVPENNTLGTVNNNDANITTISVEGGNYYFKPDEIRVKKGDTVKIILNSVDGVAHNFVIDELNVTSQTISAGQTTQVEFIPEKTGIFEFYCNIGNHRQMGMKGTLIVE